MEVKIARMEAEMCSEVLVSDNCPHCHKKIGFLLLLADEASKTENYLKNQWDFHAYPHIEACKIVTAMGDLCE